MGSEVSKSLYNLSIYFVYMKRISIQKQPRISFESVEGFFKKQVTNFGNGAKIDCPKDYLGKTVYVVIVNEDES